MFSFPVIENKRTTMALIHVLVWTLYGSFIFLANHIGDRQVRFHTTILFLLPFIGTFYAILFILRRARLLSLPVTLFMVLLLFGAMALIAYAYVYFVMPALGIRLYRADGVQPFLKNAVLGFVQYFGYALLYHYVDRSIRRERALRDLQENNLRQQLENAQMKEEELKARQETLVLEYALLRSQLNPHLLLNTLNVLYSQAQEQEETGRLADNVLKLANIMRYSLESLSGAGDQVPVQKELDNLRLFMQIQELRFEAGRQIDFIVDGNTEGQQVPPLALITGVENAFKYGDLSDPDNPLCIRLSLRPHEIYFKCRNKIRKGLMNHSSNRIGLSNLRKRLQLACKGSHSIETRIEDNFYTLELFIFN